MQANSSTLLLPCKRVTQAAAAAESRSRFGVHTAEAVPGRGATLATCPGQHCISTGSGATEWCWVWAKTQTHSPACVSEDRQPWLSFTAGSREDGSRSCPCSRSCGRQTWCCAQSSYPGWGAAPATLPHCTPTKA